ncbi:MAG: Ig-like domain-containing protein [Patescibacteria group bacterium]
MNRQNIIIVSLLFFFVAVSTASVLKTTPATLKSSQTAEVASSTTTTTSSTSDSSGIILTVPTVTYSPTTTDSPPTLLPLDTSNTTTAVSTTTQTQASITTTTLRLEEITPPITFASTKSGTISAEVGFMVQVRSAQTVELYYRREGSLTDFYLGSLLRKGTDEKMWGLLWDSRNAPNSHISVFPRVKNQYGTYDGRALYFLVSNAHEPFTTIESQQVRDIIQEKNPEVVEAQKEATKQSGTNEKEIKENIAILLDNYSNKVAERAVKAPVRVGNRTIQNREAYEAKRKIEEEATRAKKDLQETLEKRAMTLHKVQDGGFISEEAKVEILHQVDDALKSIDEEATKHGISVSLVEKESVKQDISAQVTTLQTVITKRDELVRERTGLNIFLDSDKDAVSDFDEVNLYGTDPLVADTDKDGYNDGQEVLHGFDPLDSKSEVPIVYQDPKKQGEEDKGLLRVSAITLDTSTSLGATEVVSKGSPRTETSQQTTFQRDGRLVLEGSAPPNSFATLYIFSTPIIVTVRAQANGVWKYTLDKELEDGNHEVYVAITNNSGEIVAKSSPLSFVKEASAVTIINAAGESGKSKQTLFSDTNLYALVFLGFGVVVSALVLLGLRTKKEDPVL